MKKEEVLQHTGVKNIFRAKRYKNKERPALNGNKIYYRNES
jgi:hypothetical protein